MKTRQTRWTAASGWQPLPADDSPPDLVLLFGERALLSQGDSLNELSKVWPRGVFFGCSTAGEIAGVHVTDSTVVATGIWLEKSTFQTARVTVPANPNCEELGRALVAQISTAGVVHAFVLSDGSSVNGSELVRGLTAALPPSATLSGGLSGDGAAMKSTVVCHQESGGTRRHHLAARVQRAALEVGVGSMGGWGAFGPRARPARCTTRL